jgi:carboxyl-terminal processing protease
MKSASFQKYVGFISILLLSYFIAFSAGATTPIKEVQTPPPAASPSNDTTTTGSQAQENDVTRFTNAIALINEFYVKPVSEKKLLENAIRGIVAGLDPHSEYLDEDAYKTLMMETSGEFGGIGIEVVGEYDVLKVVSPIDGTPAFKAGIKSGDYIVALNDKLVSNMSLSEAVNEIHGKKDSKLTLTVLRKNEEKPLKFTVIRDIIHIDSVKSKMLANGYGYVRISQFQEQTPTLLAKAIAELQKSSNNQLKGLVLDLRNNPGGLLESAVGVVNLFLDSKNLHDFSKLIVYTKGHLPQLQYQAKASGSDMLKGAPLVVLVNEGSASASEIVAGALQDYRRGVIVGIRSFGKGSVQTVIPLDKTHALKLTTALYYTPAGRQIQNSGIKPDVVVENFKVTSTNPDTLVLGPIREFELKNHLKSKNTMTETTASNDADATTDKKLSATDTDYADLAQQDFQLYEALKVLQAVNTVDNQKIAPVVPTDKALVDNN